MKQRESFAEFLFAMILLIVFIAVITSLMGCGDKPFIEQVRDPELSQGCTAVDGTIGFDSYFDTTKGKTGVCKLKCSDELPDCYHFKYDNPLSPCSGEVKTPCPATEELVTDE